MEEVFYILIGVAWLIYTFYSRSQKKKKMRSQGADNQQKKESFLETILKEEFGMDESSFKETVVKETFAPDPDNQSDFAKKVADSRSDYVAASPFLTTELNDYEGEGMKSTEKDKVTIKDILEHRDGIDFDLRKAIIYNEILNTPYI